MQAFLFRVWFVCCCFFSTTTLYYYSSSLLFSSHPLFRFIHIHSHSSIHPSIHTHSFIFYISFGILQRNGVYIWWFVYLQIQFAHLTSRIKEIDQQPSSFSLVGFFLLHTHTYTLIVPVPVCLLIILMWETGCACVRAYFFLSTFISPSSFWWTATNMYQLLLFSYTYVYCMW